MPSGTFCTVTTLGVSYSKKADIQLSTQKLRLALSELVTTRFMITIKFEIEKDYQKS